MGGYDNTGGPPHKWMSILPNVVGNVHELSLSLGKNFGKIPRGLKCAHEAHSWLML